MSRPGGAVAAGSPLTVQAGLEALRAGGNAVDAVVAAQLMACVAEPLLTGLCGGGLATYRVGGRVGVCDFFSDFPGLGRQEGPTRPMDAVEVDFGPTTQVFHVGAASAAAPGLPAGIWALHKRFGSMPMTRLAAPAVRTANEGFTVLPGFERVCQLLWPILSRDPQVAALMGREGRPLRAGEHFALPALGDTLGLFAHGGPELFRTGAFAQALLKALGPGALLTAEDLRANRPVFREARSVSHGGVTVHCPGPPSQGGLLVLRALDALLSGDPLPDPLSGAHVERVAQAMNGAELARTPGWSDDLFADGFADAYLSGAPMGSGYTTHMSAVDGYGNAIALTSSLGETAGMLVGDTGLMPNNFMGETDVNPPGRPRPVGARLMTMCCPSLLELPDAVYAMGSGGSSRIRSAVIHGAAYLGVHGLSPQEAVRMPRAHMEDGVLNVEVNLRPAADVAALRQRHPDLVEFSGPGMYFGGLHIAGVSQESGFSGSGDARRSGAYGAVSGT